MIVNFKKCNHAILREMVESFYEQEVEIPNDPSLEYKWSPAEVNQILFRNFGHPLQAVCELVALTPGDMYGFVENGFAQPNDAISPSQNDANSD
jgi:hypothetical protein